MNDKVVNFPSHRIVRENLDVEAIKVAKEKSTQKFADTIVEDLIGNILEDLENSGIDVESDQFIKDFSVAADMIRASVFRHFEIEHHLHDFIDRSVKMINRKTGELLEKDDVDEEV